MKYRYIMSGTFHPKAYTPEHDNVYGNFLGIDIPSPFERNSEEDAEKDHTFAYRFAKKDGEVVIIIYAKEEVNLKTDENGEKYITVQAKGRTNLVYTYEAFKSLGGVIYEMPKEAVLPLPSNVSEKEALEAAEEWMKETEGFEWSVTDYEINETFDDLFPGLDENEHIYIDDEAYYILEIE